MSAAAIADVGYTSVADQYMDPDADPTFQINGDAAEIFFLMTDNDLKRTHIPVPWLPAY